MSLPPTLPVLNPAFAAGLDRGVQWPHSAQLPITVGIVEDEFQVRGRFELAVRSNPRLSLAFSADTAATALAMAFVAAPCDVARRARCGAFSWGIRWGIRWGIHWGIRCGIRCSFGCCNPRIQL